MNLESYEREGQIVYSLFAKTIATIVNAAIAAQGGYRLQQVSTRAKQVSSLRQKLQQRKIEATQSLESDIKDLAGCRLVFYTNSDVTKFINSRIIEQNFDVLEYKLHHPSHESDNATDLYISNHYLVTLRPERIALPEYANFAGMRCEIQVQTILNHAWAEMAHDTIYKEPALGDFGSKAIDGIKRRLQKVARKYLLPAGYEFQKISYDFQRLIAGKELFDGDALEAIVEATDNNIRAEALETFTESVLPLYDDLPSIYPEIIDRLVAAADFARATQPLEIATPYGSLPAKNYADIMKAIAGILNRYRYLDIAATFNALCTLFSWSSTNEERAPLLSLGKALAEHQFHIWSEYGPAAQIMLLDLIDKIGDDERRSLTKLLTPMLSEVLGVEVRGTTSNSSTITIHRGVVIASDALRISREKAIDLLKYQFGLVESDDERREILAALHVAARPAIGASYNNSLAELVMSDTCTIISFESSIAHKLSLALLQATETRINRCYRRYLELPETMRSEQGLVELQKRVKQSALDFRDIVSANPDFFIYKILVGFDCVYPPAWEDGIFDYEESEFYRAKQVNLLLASVNQASAEIWFDRISRYAQTESNDAATFPIFGSFLERLSHDNPKMVLEYINKLDGPLWNFMPRMLIGLSQSAERVKTLILIDDWLNKDKHIDNIVWYLRFTKEFDELLLIRTFNSAINSNNNNAVRSALIAAAAQFSNHPGALIKEVFIPAILWLAKKQDFSWVRMPWVTWLNSPIVQSLDEQQASIVLDALVMYPVIEHASEHISASIAENWPALVINFLGKRQALARTDAAPNGYAAVPFTVYQLQIPLAAVPDLLLTRARAWFDSDSLHFPYDGGRLLASVFPNLTGGLVDRLNNLISGCVEEDLTFVLAVLSAFEGKPCIYELVRNIVATQEPTSSLLKTAKSVLSESGIVTGEFGFSELCLERKALLEPWLDDKNETVRIFATELTQRLLQRSAAEIQSAEAAIALRKLNCGEEL